MNRIQRWWRELRPEYRRGIYYLFLALAIFFVILLYPNPEGLSVSGQRALAVLAFVTILWVTETFTLGLTALIGVVLLPLLGVLDLQESFIGFGSTALFFLAGALTFSTAMMKTGLHKRVALKIIRKFGRSPSTLIFGVCVLGAFMSMIMPEHAVAAMMLPVLMGILGVSEKGERDNFAIATFLALTYATSVGSIGSLLGGARNVLALGILQMTLGVSVSFLDWMIAGVPIAVTLTIVVYLLLRTVYPWGKVNMTKLKQHLGREVSSMDGISWEEKKVGGIFIFCLALWLTVGTAVGLSIVAIGGMILLVTTRTITWRDIEQDMPWGLLFLYGGALTLSYALTESEAVKYLAINLTEFVGQHPFMVLLALLAMTIILSNAMSNSAATAVILPIAIPTIMSLNSGFSGLLPTYLIAMGSAMAFMLPIATPSAAIAYSSGYIGIKDMIKAGALLNILSICVFMTIGLGWWKLLGIW